ncbi:site-specific DNA-methyltransferase [Pseudohalocynthiibacter sp. F2068]|uniref:site-specific DNA-methyltransferase n=1 Tax=Pseudohalocynthiibacter sp. F2068 TaxID=2926418 RepID=UPI001FF54533|nr:site-specific DNA-methyltransferase [Pseudohalocynthiibacter sp. F2068]MCK0104384.1 site-specific DNA-methyltransferase [Pseudohalocynthiibacter sp. F2068]
MTELHFKGKEFVYNHHLSVPFHPLVPHADKGIGEVAFDGNLIVQGDNLKALKALMPMYAGKVDCVFIDPPYNTGNENWAYNDNVNAPVIKEWLASNPIGIEDGLRHDKWCAMMWPRLRLLHELLGANGSLWMTLDENEIHHARSMMDEIFGETNFIDTVIWHKNYAPKATVQYFSSDHDYLLIYAKNKETWRPNLLARSAGQDDIYKNLDNDPRGRWRPNNLAARNYYSKGTYSVKCPGGRVIKGPPSGSYWRMSEEKLWNLDKDNRIWWGEGGNNVPAPKIFLSEVRDGRVPQTLWHWSEVGHTQEAKKELLRILDFDESGDVFVTPKPSRLVKRVLDLATDENSIVLDSFSGSGTTAQAVLAANAEDEGNRRFVLVEMEDYADKVTAERVRRVINGYDYTGTQKSELLREPLNWKKLEKASDLVAKVDGIERLEGADFDKISKQIKDGELIVTGETKIEERVEGLGGSFTYCTLGDPVEMDKILTGESLPAYDQLGALLFHMATNRTLDMAGIDQGVKYLGQSEDRHVWLIYRDDLDWLKSQEAALTLSFARKIAAEKTDKPHLVFAPARFVSQKLLNEEHLRVEFAPLPFSLYRIERD